MNLTITVDDETLERARELARRQGTSVQEVIREHLATYVGDRPRAEIAKELSELFRNTTGRSGGKKFNRADAYEGRI